jgi:hypothetical protein
MAMLLIDKLEEVQEEGFPEYVEEAEEKKRSNRFRSMFLPPGFKPGVLRSGS